MADEAPPKDPTESAQAAEAQTEPAATASTASSADPVAGGKTPGGADRAGRVKATGVRQESQEPEELGGSRIWVREAMRQTPSWLVSMVFHMIVLLILALSYFSEAGPGDPRQMLASSAKVEEFDDLEEFEDEPLEDIDVTADMVAVEADLSAEEVEISPADEMEAAAVEVKLSEFGLEHAPRNDLLATVGAYDGSGLSGRGKGREALWRKSGGSEASERAVAAALKWLAEHQMPDGGWCFDHTACPRCNGDCRNPGTEIMARRGATGMALLPFLGAGQTHKSGNKRYRTTVKNGLYFLISHMQLSPQGGSLHEPGGRMYSHGLGAIALCEAFAMTKDQGLRPPAQAAINFICYAQDPIGGGWRYEARERGDTSVVGWQIMALKSGYMAYLIVPPLTLTRASQFLDSVQSDGGAIYGYTHPDIPEDINARRATTAIGLLCRMYLGWNKSEPALQRGVKWLSDKGPSSGNMYYNYYATQVMRHWEGEEWKQWNTVMREQLVNSQAKTGHEKGSWHFSKGDHGADRGGRLYCTSMATMVLEVYYRHLPIYRGQAVDGEFAE